MLQHRAVQFIAKLSGPECHGSELGLQPFKQRRRNHRLSLLMRILQDEKRRSTLSVAYDEITGDHQKVTMTTRSSARWEITSVYAASYVYHGSFLPRTITDIRGNTGYYLGSSNCA